MSSGSKAEQNHDIAVVGMALRVPGASGPDQFWENLCGGVESVQTLSKDALLRAGVDPDELNHPHYVRASLVLENMDQFDAGFFGLSPKEAAIMDPQHRHFLECGWEALEDAFHPPERFEGAIGVFAGCGMGSYFALNLLNNPELVSSVGLFLLRHTGNDKDFLATRLSYCLNLTGPAVNVQTACSTSLVAIHTGSVSLLNYECDMALAGGVTIEIPHGRGYMYKPGEILSPDGHCRAFDHRAGGTLFGSGVGMVVLRRLGDALEDGDRVYAVIRGSAVNNDGSAKVGYLAPGVEGQSSAVAEALAMADVSADTIQYVECHGTGTEVGDPIEISALTRAFELTTQRKGYCAIGSVKCNIGHLDTAAGVVSFIKTVLAVHHGVLPPSINFEAPNPNIDFENSPFHVNAKLANWPETKGPRRACVNSLGVGGTNAHVVLEQAPEQKFEGESEGDHTLLVLSAQSRNGLDDACLDLGAYLEKEQPDLVGVAHTLLRGRRAFNYRRVGVFANLEEAALALQDPDPQVLYTHEVAKTAPQAVFMFPGGGVQYPNMGRDLYLENPLFRKILDQGLDHLEKNTSYPYRDVLFPSVQEQASIEMERPMVQLPLIFLMEYALAQMLIQCGVKPAGMIGHSMGENTAAAVAGVFTFIQALDLVTLRGELFEKLPLGGMLSVALSEAELRLLLPVELDLAVVNGPNLCVVSGPSELLKAFGEVLAARDVEFRPIRISVAAHSRALEPILEPFEQFLRGLTLRAPNIPFISNRTGDWITGERATDPEYWVDHLRGQVLFAQGLSTVLASEDRVLLDMGPGQILVGLARMTANKARNILPLSRRRDGDISDQRQFLEALGRLWACGVEVDEQALCPAQRSWVRLPTYPFQHRRYWIEPARLIRAESKKTLMKMDGASWFYEPVWRTRSAEPSQDNKLTWWVFLDQAGTGQGLIRRLKDRGHEVVVVRDGDTFVRHDSHDYSLAPETGLSAYLDLVKALMGDGLIPQRIVHLWSLTTDKTFRPGSSFYHHTQERGFYSLFFLGKALIEENFQHPVHLFAAVNGLLSVNGERVLCPTKATILGPCKVMPREIPHFSCSVLDVEMPGARAAFLGPEPPSKEKLDVVAQNLDRFCAFQPSNGVYAFRNNQFLCQEWTPKEPELLKERARPLREKGVYLITGGLGGLGLALAEYLAEHHHARLALIGRSMFPDPDEWDEWLASHGAGNKVSSQIRAIRRMEEWGGRVITLQADVANIGEMRRAATTVIRRFGGIHGVFHTAGVLNDGLISMKNQWEASSVLSPKVQGAMILDEILKKVSLDFIVLFSSSSTAVAPAGQVDYVAANAFLNAYALKKSHKNRVILSVNWGLWNKVGMTAKIMDRVFERSPVQQLPTRHPLFETREVDEYGQNMLRGHFRAASHWVVNDHRTVDGEALLPGTGYIELAWSALSESGELRPTEIQDLIFLRPLFVEEGEDKSIRVKMRRVDADFALEVQSLFTPDGASPGWETHVMGRLSPCGFPSEKRLDLESLRQRCPRSHEASGASGLRTGQWTHLRLGARWHVIRRIQMGEGEALAELELPLSFVDDLDHYLAHPALLDMATGYPMDLVEGYQHQKSEHLWIPLSYHRIRLYHRLPRRIFSWARNREHNSVDGETIAFDITITDSDGLILMEIKGFSLKKLQSGQVAHAPTAASDLEGVVDTGERSFSEGELALKHNMEQGIQPLEGMRILERMLETGCSPNILVSSLDLQALMEQATELSRPSEQEAERFSRPDLNSAYAAPETEVERTLASFWESLLGVEKVGIDDDFFDLGGHSLIAVRLFAMIKETFHVSYPISVLFEAPTIRRCAALLREGSDGGENDDELGRTHLVAMHSGNPGSRTPFFLVAGMFGNVLNLRHLAHLIGLDRPFYGLQARGLQGVLEPHTRFPKMAEDYLEEIRSVQPKGPYILGGFSGGGITAYEMAQQLTAQGEEVRRLILLDTPLPLRPPLSRSDKLRIHAMRLKEEKLGYVSEWAANRLIWELGRFRRRLGLDKGMEDQPSVFHSVKIEAAFREALAHYQLKPFSGSVTLFRPALDRRWELDGRVINSEREYVFEDNGWSPYVDNLDVLEVPGDHDSMVLEPNVRTLAEKLADCIGRSSN